jgi:signal transduction histidine kinase
VERITAGQRHLLGLINAVLSFARVEAGHVTWELETFALAEVLAALETLVEPQVRARGLAFACPPCDPSLAVHADREKVSQVVLNLLSNAIKFTEGGGWVAVEAAAADDMVEVRVADSGVGIPPDRLEHIFEPFVQVDSRLTRAADGVGLGLAISRELARGMGGELSVRSAPGQGSVFVLRLPRAAA